jgi:5-methylthioadenosine/S-adenosylhomocysteine deaminase
MNHKTLIENGIFITLDDQKPVVKGYMIIEGDQITYVGEELTSPKESFDEVIDGKHRLYMPGLVNTHGHAAMSLLRGYADDMALQVWLEEYMWPNEAKFTAHDVRYGSLLSIVEMLKGGTTCFVDMYDHMDEVARAVEESGIRGSLTRGMIGFGGDDVVKAKLQEAKRFAQNWNNQADGRITTMMAPHSAYTCPPEFIEQIVGVAAELNLPIHTHMSETLYEVEENERQYGLRPVEHLQRLGVFSRPCIVAHGVHLNDKEIDILKHHDVRVSHNPGSNLKLASGIARLTDLMNAGVLVSLGTDSSASNNNLDMFEEMRLVALLHKGISGDPTAIPAIEALRMGTVNGAKSIWLENVGVLKPGMKADFIGINIDQPHFLPKTDFISHVIYSAAAQDVYDVWVNGRRVVKNREVLTLDEEKIKYEFSACYQRLMGSE